MPSEVSIKIPEGLKPRPGQPLFGQVELEFSGPVTISALEISLVGTSYSRYVSGEWRSLASKAAVALATCMGVISKAAGQGMGTPELEISEPITSKETHTIINKSWNVPLPSADLEDSTCLKIQAGDIVVIPFQIDLPHWNKCTTGQNHKRRDLPPTFTRHKRLLRTKDATVEYKLKATATDINPSTGSPSDAKFEGKAKNFTMYSPLCLNIHKPPEDAFIVPGIKLKKHYRSKANFFGMPKVLKFELKILVSMSPTVSKSNSPRPNVLLLCNIPASEFMNKQVYDVKKVFENEKKNGPTILDEMTPPISDVDVSRTNTINMDSAEYLGNEKEVCILDAVDEEGSGPHPTAATPETNINSPDTTTSSETRGRRRTSSSTLLTSIPTSSASSAVAPTEPAGRSLSTIYINAYSFQIKSTITIRANDKKNRWASDDAVTIFESSRPQKIDLSHLAPLELPERTRVDKLLGDNHNFGYAMDISDCFHRLKVGKADLTPTFKTCNIKLQHKLNFGLKLGTTEAHSSTSTNALPKSAFSDFKTFSIVD